MNIQTVTFVALTMLMLLIVGGSAAQGDPWLAMLAASVGMFGCYIHRGGR